MTKTFCYRTLIENIEPLTEEAESFMADAKVPQKTAMQICVALDEVFSNIANYAFPDGVGDASVTFDIDPGAREIRIQFVDSGIPYDPWKNEDPDIHADAEHRQVGGLGIFIVRKTMDEVSYEFVDKKNVVHLLKRY